ncbi:curli production assembly/transport component CsgF [Flavobacterium sp. W22_SRS_FP1]|uniref:curli production assembly/transport component CsgF n=1 Tax=Flavobacterium sp. W22_SRS_FP1 TaxID=3240276 RepID=UPI003F8EDA8D
MKFLIISILLFVSTSLSAQDLVYKPRNPAFGGDTFNYQWLLSSAESQNKLKENASNISTAKTELERFTENLNTQLLSQVSRSLFTQQFGTGGISEGSYSFGSLSVEVYPSEGGLIVDILDTNTGEQTQVIIPKQ